MKHTTLIFGILACLVVTQQAIVPFSNPFKWFCNTRIEGSGKLVTQVRTVSPFKNISASKTHVVVTQGDRESVTVQADDNLIDRVLVSVQGDTRHISMQEGAFNTKNAITVQVVVRQLASIAGSSTAHFDLTDISGTDLRIQASDATHIDGTITLSGDVYVLADGAAHIELAGTVGKEILTCAGAADYDAKALQAQSTDVSGAGVAKIYLGTRQTIRGMVEGASELKYRACENVQVATKGVASAKTVR